MYSIEIFPKRFLKPRVVIENSTITIYLSESQKESQAKELLEKFLIEFARKYITNKANKFSKDFDFKFNKIAIKEQKSRWGSCSSLNNLNFNWRLIFAIPEVIDYVIIHELAHTKQMNHSSAFWSVVEQCMPHYSTYRNWLKQNGRYLFTAF